MSEETLFLVYYPIQRENNQKSGGPLVIVTNTGFSYAAFASKTLAKAFIKRIQGKSGFTLISSNLLDSEEYPELVKGVSKFIRFDSQNMIDQYLFSRRLRQHFDFESHLVERF